MSYYLDTNVVIALLRDRPPSVRQRFREAESQETIFLSSVVLFELWYGVERSSRREENAERLRVFLSGNVHVVPFEGEDASLAGALRASLEAAGTPIAAAAAAVLAVHRDPKRGPFSVNGTPDASYSSSLQPIPMTASLCQAACRPPREGNRRRRRSLPARAREARGKDVRDMARLRKKQLLGSADWDTLREAFAYASEKQGDPTYEAVAAARGTSPFRVATADFLHAPEIDEVDLDEYHGQPGDAIRVKAHDDVMVTEVGIIIVDEENRPIEMGKAEQQQGEWLYRARSLARVEHVRIIVDAADLPGNMGEARVDRQLQADP